MEKNEAREKAYQHVAAIVREALYDGYSSADNGFLSDVDSHSVDQEIQWILDYLLLYAYPRGGYEQPQKKSTPPHA